MRTVRMKRNIKGTRSGRNRRKRRKCEGRNSWRKWGTRKWRTKLI
jgi:hypothetical protein